jgi:hypothetical protein
MFQYVGTGLRTGKCARCAIAPAPEVMDRKLALLRRFVADLGGYARLDSDGLPADWRDGLVAACRMRKVLTHFMVMGCVPLPIRQAIEIRSDG